MCGNSVGNAERGSRLKEICGAVLQMRHGKSTQQGSSDQRSSSTDWQQCGVAASAATACIFARTILFITNPFELCEQIIVAVVVVITGKMERRPNA